MGKTSSTRFVSHYTAEDRAALVEIFKRLPGATPVACRGSEHAGGLPPAEWPDAGAAKAPFLHATGRAYRWKDTGNADSVRAGLAHIPLVGIGLEGARLFVLDNDRLAVESSPLPGGVVVPSRTGQHILHRRGEGPFKDAKWRSGAAGGEIKARGFVVVWWPRPFLDALDALGAPVDWAAVSALVGAAPARAAPVNGVLPPVGAVPSMLAELGGIDPIGKILAAPEGSCHNIIVEEAARAGRLGSHTVEEVVAAARARCSGFPHKDADKAERTARSQYAWGVAQGASAKAAGEEGPSPSSKATNGDTSSSGPKDAPDEKTTDTSSSSQQGGKDAGGPADKPWTDSKGRVKVAGKSEAGLAEALSISGWSVRYSTRSAGLEFRHGDGPWKPQIKRVSAQVCKHLFEQCCYMVRPKEGGKPVPIPLRIGSSELTTWCLGIVMDTTGEVDPFLEWAESCKDDPAAPRIEQMLHDTLGVERNDYTDWHSSFVWLRAAELALKPGRTRSVMPVWLMPTGRGKTTLIGELAPPDHPEWIGESLDMQALAKERVESILGCVWAEAAEFNPALSRKDLARAKAWITRRNDRGVRLSYDPRPEDQPRRTVIIATSDAYDGAIPNDPNSVRRFPVLEVPRDCQRPRDG